MRILGIDPGSRILGYAVVEGTEERLPRLTYVECGVIQVEDGALEVKLAEISRGIADVIRDLAPTVAAVEDVFFGASARSALALGQARGAALAACGLAGLAVHAYPPAVIKQAITGHGRASKEQVARMLCALIGLRRPPRPDAADALAVAITHAHLRRGWLERVA